MARVVLGRPQYCRDRWGQGNPRAGLDKLTFKKNPECNESVLFNIAALVAHVEYMYALSWIEWGPLLICGDAPCELVKNPSSRHPSRVSFI